MEKYYRFAGICLAVTPPAGVDFEDDRQLAPFRAEKAEDAHRFSFEAVRALTPPAGKPVATLPDYTVYEEDGAQVRYIGSVQGRWEEAHMRCVHRGKSHTVQLRQGYFPQVMTAKTLLNSCATEHLLARAGGFVFHCAYIDHGGRGILFTAPSGTGKSTQAQLWQTHRGAAVINGDRAAVTVRDGVALAEGIPFSGSSQICINRSLPLAAIVYLSQGRENTVRLLRGAQAFARVWEGISLNVWDKEDVAAVSDTVQQLLQTVPVYHLVCTPDELAVAALEAQLGK